MKKLPGSSLVEILVATLVVGLALTSVVFLMSVNVKSSQDAELRANAVIFSQQGVDLVRNQRTLLTWQGFVAATTPCSGGPCNFNNPFGCDTSQVFAGTTFTRNCSLGVTGAACPAAGTHTLSSTTQCSYTTQTSCRLRVLVTWTSGSNSNSVCTIQDFWNR